MTLNLNNYYASVYDEVRSVNKFIKKYIYYKLEHKWYESLIYNLRRGNLLFDRIIRFHR